MKNPVTTKLFSDEFCFLKEHKFTKKGSLFIRLVNNEIIQTVYLFKTSPIWVDINIGMFSIYEEFKSYTFKEGIYRLSSLFNNGIEWDATRPQKALLDMKELLIDRVIPLFDVIINIDELIKYRLSIENYFGEFHPDMLINYIAIQDYGNAVSSLDFYITRLLSCMDDRKNDETGLFPEVDFDGYMKEIERLKHMKMEIEQNSIPYIVSLLCAAKETTQKILEGYQIALK